MFRCRRQPSLNALSMLTSRKMLVTKAALDDLVAAAKKHSRDSRSRHQGLIATPNFRLSQ